MPIELPTIEGMCADAQRLYANQQPELIQAWIRNAYLMGHCDAKADENQRLTAHVAQLNAQAGQPAER